MVKQKIELKCDKINLKSFYTLLQKVNDVVEEIGMEDYVEVEVKKIK